MASTTLDPPSTVPVPSAQVDFPDNRLLIDLCGPFDANLTQIESMLGVQIVRRGNALDIHGEAAEEARDVVAALYARLEQGKSIEAGDISALIRLAGSDEGTGRRDGDPIEMFYASVEIRTRKKTVEPRTDAQKAYTRALLDSELTFGIVVVLLYVHR